MSEYDENGVDSTLETPEDVELDTTDEEDIEVIKAELAKAKELANNYKIRAEKAEKPKEIKPTVKPNTAKDINAVDMYALLEAKVPLEDMDVVRKYASMENISIAEALKTSIVKSILSDNQEKRNTASAANVGTAKRASNKVSDEALMENARQGKMPESAEEIERLNRIRRGQK